MKNIGLWLKGLAAAAIGGAVASVAQAAAAGGIQPKNLVTSALAGAFLTLGAYLTQSPLGTK
jgi:hypothetical protein